MERLIKQSRAVCALFGVQNHFQSVKYLTFSYTGFFRLDIHGPGGMGLGHKVTATIFSETVKATTIKLVTLIN